MYKRELRDKVARIIENSYKMDINTADKVLDIFFSPDYLPRWYFYSNTPETITRHIYMYSQLLNANSRYIEDVEESGKNITYFVNVGRDTPGRVEKLIEENLDMSIGSFDAEYTRSGVSIVSITKKGRSDFKVPEELWISIKKILKECNDFCIKYDYKYGVDFLNSIQLDYLSEEVTSHSPGVRLYRHLEYYERAMECDNIVIFEDFAAKKIGDKKENTDEKRLALSLRNPSEHWVIDMLKIIKEKDISINRVYYDLIEGKNSIGILSIYLESNLNIDSIKTAIENYKDVKSEDREKSELNSAIDNIIRALTTLEPDDERFKDAIIQLRSLCRLNSDITKKEEFNNFYLNSVSDFFKGAEFIGIDENLDLMSKLLGYESLDEFFVSCRNGNGIKSNKPGYRAKHNSLRGPCKGGLRIDSIVRYDEIAALSFMMTWKCARSKILFGGGKGGLKLNPKDFINSKMDFFDTLSNFGRSIFSVTGPAKDVPAGDVGCGAREIGHLFEGFKSALRDLALLAFGVKKGVAQIGNRLISVDEARKILYENFDIDYLDRDILLELATKEEYLNLVTAAQITGKPNMGIRARTGATGRGLCYSILQTVTNLYLLKQWIPSDVLTDEEIEILTNCSKFDESVLIKNTLSPLIPEKHWEILEDIIYPKLLMGKRVVVQGSGKVGSSIISELSKYGINLIAVADAGGAIIGNKLDLNEILQQVSGDKRSVIGCQKNVNRVIYGAQEGAEILTLDCDILIPAALENAITNNNAKDVKAQIIACGSNGPCSSKAEEILTQNKKVVIYDFLANGAGVIASYFEWLRNLYDRFFYEAIVIKKEEFTFDKIEKYIMPEFSRRIKAILEEEEGDWTTDQWNIIIRDIIFTEINEDLTFSLNNSISMKTAGFVNSILRVLAASIVKSGRIERQNIWNSMSGRSRELIRPYFFHPESEMLCNNIAEIQKELFP